MGAVRPCQRCDTDVSMFDMSNIQYRCTVRLTHVNIDVMRCTAATYATNSLIPYMPIPCIPLPYPSLSQASLRHVHRYAMCRYAICRYAICPPIHYKVGWCDEPSWGMPHRSAMNLWMTVCLCITLCLWEWLQECGVGSVCSCKSVELEECEVGRV